MRAISAVVGVMLALSSAALVSGQQASQSPLKATFSKLPIYFVENRGVYPDEVSYYVQGADKTLLFTKEGITFRLKDKDKGWVVKLEFVGANPDVTARGEDRQQAVFSYFKGREKDWKTGLKTYAKVVYEDLWPGIDLVYKGTVNRLKYEFVVKPGADPGQIRLRYRGSTEATLTDAGGLRIATPVGSFEDEPPVAWQGVDDKRVPVDLSFRLDPVMQGEGTAFGVWVGDYDRTRPLTLDPALLIYCGYLGGTGMDYGSAIAVDGAGNAYLTGNAWSDENTFPVRVGPNPIHSSPGQADAFVAKVSAQGTKLIYCGYIGGAANDSGQGVAVDGAGNAYVFGCTDSDEKSFPVMVGPDLTYNGGIFDAFVAKVNAQGTALAGFGDDRGFGIDLDAAGNAYVSGFTSYSKSSFPVTVGPDLTYNGGPYDAFVAKVNAQGTALAYCGYIGGSGSDHCYGIAVDAAGNAYVAGETDSNEKSFPVTVGPDLTYNAQQDAFVAKVNANGSALVYCGYIGGARPDTGQDVAADANGNAYVTGSAYSDETTFPVTVGPDLTFNGGEDAFVAWVNPKGTGLLYCGYIGGSANEVAYGIAIDPAGNACVAGITGSDEKTFPVVGGPDLTYNGGFFDAFVAKVNAQGTALAYSGYIGGADTDSGNGLSVDLHGNVYVAGTSRSDAKTFPVTVGPCLFHRGSDDAFVAKVSLTVLEGKGTPRPGGTVGFTLTATNDVGRQFHLGTSLGTGPIPIDTRQIDLSPDNLLLVTVNNYWPSVFSGYRGVIDSKGQAQAAIHIPNLPALIGTRIHTAFVTLDSAAPSGIRSISNTFSFSITK